MDWLGRLTAVHDASVLHASLDAANETEGEIEAVEGSMAIAAAEVVAALHGRPAASLPAEVTEWIAAHALLADVGLLEKALRAVLLVGEDGERSELKQLWDDAKESDAEEWHGHSTDLLVRLS
jgi:hypothetical protein